MFVEQPISLPRYPNMIIFISTIRFRIFIFCVCLFMYKITLVVCFFLPFQKILFQREKGKHSFHNYIFYLKILIISKICSREAKNFSVTCKVVLPRNKPAAQAAGADPLPLKLLQLAKFNHSVKWL